MMAWWWARIVDPRQRGVVHGYDDPRQRCGKDVTYLGHTTTSTTMVPLSSSHRSFTFVLLSITLFVFSPAYAQLLSDPLEELGDETYFGFGAGNWADANDFGFSNHAGNEAFLSNYTGTPLNDLGMIKPLNAIIGSGSYRVSFYYSRYSSIDPVPYSEYDSLYIGSPNGSMIWDTVPTPATTGVWLRWSGVFTPAPQDIGEPFRFGFTLDLASGTSLAIDGPLEIVDLATSMAEPDMANGPLQVFSDLQRRSVTVRGSQPFKELLIIDAMGRVLHAPSQVITNGREIDASMLPSGHYSIVVSGSDGAIGKGCFVVM